MSVSVLYMSMSLDGYIAGPNHEPGNPGADRFMRLHEWYGFDKDEPDPSDWQCAEKPGMDQHFLSAGNATRAVLVGGGRLSRSTTGAGTITGSRSSWPVTGHPTRPSRSSRW